MRILFDFQGMQSVAGGVPRCICEYIKGLQREHKVKIACPHTSNIYMSTMLGKRLSRVMKLPNSTFRRHLASLLNLISSWFAVLKNDYDIFHPTMDRFVYYLGIIKKPYVITIHDMIPELYYAKEPEKHKKLNPWLDNKKRAIVNATRIMCVSENTKLDLLKCYPSVNPDVVDVVYHGIDSYNKEYTENKNGRYILYVGQRNAYKNFLFTVEALKPLLEQHSDIRILCTGKPFTQQELSCLYGLNLEKKVVSVGFVNDDELANLYHHALLFIYPSKYEGFGIPILEAFEHGCPTCLANASCFPEIGGDSVLYFDPDDMASILNTVEKIIYNERLADELRDKGKKRVKLFTWENATKKVVDCYKKALSIQ